MQNAQTANEENLRLNDHILELRTKIPGAIYYPVKFDETDKVLAKYLNTMTGRRISSITPAIMFQRVADGHYQFGTKRIYLKILNDQIMVRVGGGWEDIESFLD
jgi:hypothetical protein